MELLFTSLSTLFIWLPKSPENSSFLLNCLGNDEIYFDFDFFTPGGHSRKKQHCLIENLAGKYICQGTLILLVLVGSNICDFFLTSAVLYEMKKSTISVKSMLSKSAFATRKRYVLSLSNNLRTRNSSQIPSRQLFLP